MPKMILRHGNKPFLLALINKQDNILQKLMRNNILFICFFYLFVKHFLEVLTIYHSFKYNPRYVGSYNQSLNQSFDSQTQEKRCLNMSVFAYFTQVLGGLVDCF